MSEHEMQLYKHQIDGVNFAIGNENIILADEPGLGKTLQAMVYFKWLYHNAGVATMLIVCPASLISNIQNESETWLGVRAHKYFSQKGVPHDVTILVTSYEMFRKDHLKIQRIVGENCLFVLDEAHRISNQSSKTTKACWNFKSAYRMAMTGTPIQNKPEDLYSLLRFVNPELSGTDTVFQRMFLQMRPQKIRTKHGTITKYIVAGYKNLDRLNMILSKIMIRRVLPDCVDMPERITQYHPYTADDPFYVTMRAEIDLSGDNALVKLGMLQQTLSGVNPFSDATQRPWIQTSKSQMLVDLLDTLCAQRVIVWFRFKHTLRPILDFVKETTGRECFVYHGDLDQAQKDNHLNAFKQSDNGILFATIRCGGEGLNITEATHSVFFEVELSPTKMIQAEGRNYRITQVNRVVYHYLYGAGTIEQSLLYLLSKKKKLNSVVTDEFTEEELNMVYQYSFDLGLQTTGGQI